MTRPLLGIMAVYMSGKKLEELTYFRQLCLQGEKLGVDVYVFTPEDEHPTKRAVHALTYDNQRWVKKWIALPNVIYDRCRYQSSEKFYQLRAFRSKHPELNYLSRPLTNKWAMHDILSSSPKLKKHMPQTVKFHGAKDLKTQLSKHPLLFLKPINGTGGRGILRLQRSGDGFLVSGRTPQRRLIGSSRMTAGQIESKIRSWGLIEKYVIQQGIPLTLSDGRVHDFRLLIQKTGSGVWDITGCAGRIGPSGSVTSNLHGGGSAISLDRLLHRKFASSEKVASVKKAMHQLGYDIAEHLESKFGSLCELGIDLAVDPNGDVYILEVNPKPSREVFRKIGELNTYRKAISRPLEYAMWKMRDRVETKNKR